MGFGTGLGAAAYALPTKTETLELNMPGLVCRPLPWKSFRQPRYRRWTAPSELRFRRLIVTRAVVVLLLGGMGLACSTSSNKPVSGGPRALDPRTVFQRSPFSEVELLVYAPGLAIEAHYRVLGTLTRDGSWLWAWVDPSVPIPVRVGRDSLSGLSQETLDPAWRPQGGELDKVVRSVAQTLNASHYGVMKSVIGERYVLLFNPTPLAPPPP